MMTPFVTQDVDAEESGKAAADGGDDGDGGGGEHGVAVGEGHLLEVQIWLTHRLGSFAILCTWVKII